MNLKDWSERIYCTNRKCNCIFDANYNDIVIYRSKTKRDNSVYYSGEYFHAYAICPVCEKKIKVAIALMPYEQLISYKLYNNN